MDILSTLFGGDARVRLMRLFLFNQDEHFELDIICQKSKIKSSFVQKELVILEKAELIKKRSVTKSVVKIIRKKKIIKKTRVNVYYLNKDFTYITALKQLLIKTKTLEGGELVKKLSKIGKLKMVIVAGVFIQDKDSRVDILIVGNDIKKPSLNNAIKSIEAEIGKELVYVCFDTNDFQYRLGMCDKLIRDVLDYPHQVLLDRISS